MGSVFTTFDTCAGTLQVKVFGAGQLLVEANFRPPPFHEGCLTIYLMICICRLCHLHMEEAVEQLENSGTFKFGQDPSAIELIHIK